MAKGNSRITNSHALPCASMRFHALPCAHVSPCSHPYDVVATFCHAISYPSRIRISLSRSGPRHQVCARCPRRARSPLVAGSAPATGQAQATGPAAENYEGVAAPQCACHFPGPGRRTVSAALGVVQQQHGNIWPRIRSHATPQSPEHHLLWE